MGTGSGLGLGLGSIFFKKNAVLRLGLRIGLTLTPTPTLTLTLTLIVPVKFYFFFTTVCSYYSGCSRVAALLITTYLLSQWTKLGFSMPPLRLVAYPTPSLFFQLTSLRVVPRGVSKTQGRGRGRGRGLSLI